MITKRILMGTILMIAIASALGASWFYTHNEPTLRLPGTVEIQEVRLSSKIGGRIKYVHAQEGMIAAAGQPLVVFDVPEWEAKRAQPASAAPQLAEAQLLKARNGAPAGGKSVESRRPRDGPRPFAPPQERHSP